MEKISNIELQKQRLNYLISTLISETDYQIQIPENIKEKHFIYKSLCNMRSPNPLSQKFISTENAYLQERLKTFTLTNVNQIQPLITTHSFLSETNRIKNLKNICLWKGDITKLQIDAIVNAGNNEGLGCFVPTHICIDNQIHSEAGTGLRLECYEYMKKINRTLLDGEAMITDGYNLPCKKVIQTVGPCLDQSQEEKPTQAQIKSLGECYINSLKLLVQNNLNSIAFPAISTGLFGFPKFLAAKIAISKIDEFVSGLDNNHKDNIKVVINVYDDNNLKVYENVIIKEFYK
jgi:O-acetyl-ADP-ribose deacetylase (regulator of RNase III)